MATRKEKLITPIGTAQYCYLKSPDYTFNKEGVFRTQLLLLPDDAKELCARLDELNAEAFEEAKKKNPGKKVRLNPAYTEDVDDDENPTGFLVFKFKSAAKFTRPNGEEVNKVIPAFDAKMRRIEDPPAAYTGTKMRIAFTAAPYYVEAHKTAGLSLFIQSYQLIELVTYSSDGAYYGFQEEEGYSIEDEAQQKMIESNVD